MPTTPTNHTPTGLIIDISKWNYGQKGNASIDFRQVKPQVDGIMVRSGNGLTRTDSRFLVGARGCINNGIPWGSYHFANFTEDAKAQAERFMARVKQVGTPSMPMALDVETDRAVIPITGQQLEFFCETILSTLAANGYDTCIYMSPGFSWFLPKGHKLGKYKLWVADYTGSINPVNGWDKAWLHQFSDQGRIAGIPTSVDMDKLM